MCLPLAVPPAEPGQQPPSRRSGGPGRGGPPLPEMDGRPADVSRSDTARLPADPREHNPVASGQTRGRTKLLSIPARRTARTAAYARGGHFGAGRDGPSRSLVKESPQQRRSGRSLFALGASAEKAHRVSRTTRSARCGPAERRAYTPSHFVRSVQERLAPRGGRLELRGGSATCMRNVREQISAVRRSGGARGVRCACATNMPRGLRGASRCPPRQPQITVSRHLDAHLGAKLGRMPPSPPTEPVVLRAFA